MFIKIEIHEIRGSKGVNKTLSHVYDGAFFAKIVTD